MVIYAKGKNSGKIDVPFGLIFVFNKYLKVLALTALKARLFVGFISILLSCGLFAQEDDAILEYIPAILASIKKLPKPIDFKVATPTIANSNEYVIDLDEYNIPINANASATVAENTTDRLQEAIDWANGEGYGRVVFPAGNYLIGKYGNSRYQAGIDLHGQTEYVLSSGTVFEMYTNDKSNYCIVQAQNKTDVIIRGGTIKGDKANHLYTADPDGNTTHSEGHAICVFGSERVLVKDMTIHSVTGDGSLLLNSNDISYQSNNINNNRRQGISVVGGIRVSILNNEIHHTKGVSPQFGVDIEGAGREDRDILIRNNYFHHNRGGDIVNTSGKNVFIVNNVMDQGTEGFDYRYIDGPIVTWERTDNVIAYNDITMYNGSYNGRLGFIQYSGDNDNNPETTYVHDNVCNNCGMYMYKAEGADVQNNKFYGYFMAFGNFKNLVLANNLVTYSDDGPRYCWSYRFNNVLGVASGNYIEDQPANIPLSTTKPYTLQCVLDGF